MYDYFTAPTPDPIDPDAVEFMGKLISYDEAQKHLDHAVQYINSILEYDYFEIYAYFKAHKAFDYIAFAGWVLEPLSEDRGEYRFSAKLYVGTRPGMFTGTFEEVLKHIMKPVQEIL